MDDSIDRPDLLTALPHHIRETALQAHILERITYGQLEQLLALAHATEAILSVDVGHNIAHVALNRSPDGEIRKR